MNRDLRNMISRSRLDSQDSASTQESSLAAYEILTELGRGSFGVVHKGRRKRDNKICVLKQVSIRHFKTEKQKTQALMEAKIMKQLNSAHIVEYIDAFLHQDPQKDQEFLYIVIQFCSEGDLKTMLAKKVEANPSHELPERTIWRLFLRVALGLEYLHSRRVLHRDLKSENVFLTGNDAVRIGDLGLAKMLTNTATGASTLCGTPRYLSPEEVIGSTHYNEKSDVWALGVILYELCSDGHRGPFDEATRIPALLQKIVNEEPPSLPVRNASELQEVTSRLLDKNVLQRPAISELLATQVVQTHAEKHGIAEIHHHERSRDQHRFSVPSIPSAIMGDDRSELGATSGSIRSPGEMPDGFFSKVGSMLGIRGVEAADAPRFHRMGACEICVAQNGNLSSFAVSRRRHHCRSCGRSICRQHAVAKRSLPQFGYTLPVRICEICSLMPSDEQSHSSRPLVVVADSRAHAWDTSSIDAPCWAVGESLRWGGLGTLKSAHEVDVGSEVFLTLGSLQGSQLEIRSLQYGEVIGKLSIPGQLEDGPGFGGREAARSDVGLDKSPRNSIASVGFGAPGVRPVKNTPVRTVKSPSAQSPQKLVNTVELAACSGHWFAVVARDPAGSKGEAQPGITMLRILELPDGAVLGSLWCNKAVTALAVQSGAEGFVVVASEDFAVRVHSVPMADEALGLVAALIGHTAVISSISVGANANFICTGSQDKTVRLWRRQTGTKGPPFKANLGLEVCEEFRDGNSEVAPNLGGSSVVCDGQWLAFVQAARLGTWEQGASLWNLALGKWERSFFKRGHSVNCVAHRGVVLATGATSRNKNCSVQLWHSPTGTALSSIQSPAERVSRLSLAFVDESGRQPLSLSTRASQRTRSSRGSMDSGEDADEGEG